VADVNDATAEVFLVAWKKLGLVPAGDETLPWLYGVARNVVRNADRSSRRSGRLVGRLGGLAPRAVPGPARVKPGGTDVVLSPGGGVRRSREGAMRRGGEPPPLGDLPLRGRRVV
jgi:hypothetical protein